MEGSCKVGLEDGPSTRVVEDTGTFLLSDGPRMSLPQVPEHGRWVGVLRCNPTEIKWIGIKEHVSPKSMSGRDSPVLLGLCSYTMDRSQCRQRGPLV